MLIVVIDVALSCKISVVLILDVLFLDQLSSNQSGSMFCSYQAQFVALLDPHEAHRRALEKSKDKSGVTNSSSSSNWDPPRTRALHEVHRRATSEPRRTSQSFFWAFHWPMNTSVRHVNFHHQVVIVLFHFTSLSIFFSNFRQCTLHLSAAWTLPWRTRGGAFRVTFSSSTPTTSRGVGRGVPPMPERWLHLTTWSPTWSPATSSVLATTQVCIGTLPSPGWLSATTRCRIHCTSGSLGTACRRKPLENIPSPCVWLPSTWSSN